MLAELLYDSTTSEGHPKTRQMFPVNDTMGSNSLSCPFYTRRKDIEEVLNSFLYSVGLCPWCCSALDITLRIIINLASPIIGADSSWTRSALA